MRATLLLLIALAAPAAANQTVWKWVDKDGVTHYADRPVPGATRIELSGGGNRADPQPTASPSSSSGSPAPAAGPPYQTFEIWKPAEGDTVANTGGQVEVYVRVEPTLRPGHTVHLYLDGRVVEAHQGALQHTLTEVPRGTHSLVAAITAQGERIQQTAPVTFFVRQESAANPPVGPAIRPAPKPRASNNKPLTRQPTYAALNGQNKPVDPRTNLPRVFKPIPARPKP